MGMKGSFKSGFYHVAILFLVSLIVFSVYAVNAFGETYMYDSTLGDPGALVADNSHFWQPYGLTVDNSGNLYVSDTDNYRIQIYNSSGVYVSTIGVTGVWGSDSNHFDGAWGVAVDSAGNVYVADTYNYRIQKFNSSGMYESTLGVTDVLGTDNSHFSWGPYGVAVDRLGNVYAADTGNERIQKFDSSGVYLSTIGITGVIGSDNSHFWGPMGVAVDGSGNVYVSDQGNERIQKYDSNGVYLSTIGITGVIGSDNSHFWEPWGVAVDRSDNLYVADTSNQRIQKFNSNGVYLSTIGVTGVIGYDNSHFANPAGVAVDDAGNVYVADTGNSRIQKYKPVPGDNCTATLSSDLSLHVPVATYYGQFYTGDFQWDGGTGVILVNDTQLIDTSAFDSCIPATVTNDLGIHIPAIMYNGVSYWADLRFDQGVNFTVTGDGAN